MSTILSLQEVTSKVSTLTNEMKRTEEEKTGMCQQQKKTFDEVVAKFQLLIDERNEILRQKDAEKNSLILEIEEEKRRQSKSAADKSEEIARLRKIVQDQKGELELNEIDRRNYIEENEKSIQILTLEKKMEDDQIVKIETERKQVVIDNDEKLRILREHIEKEERKLEQYARDRKMAIMVRTHFSDRHPESSDPEYDNSIVFYVKKDYDFSNNLRDFFKNEDDEKMLQFIFQTAHQSGFIRPENYQH